MDEVLTRRLLGAAVLLVLAFGLASLLPDADPARAPAADGKVVRYDLRTGRRIEAELEVEVPAPAPAPAAEPPRTAVQLQESLALSEIDSWYVQVGSFKSEANARGVLVKLYQLGMPTKIQSEQVNRDLWFRVRVGPYRAEDKAQDALKKIRAQGYDGAKVVHTAG